MNEVTCTSTTRPRSIVLWALTLSAALCAAGVALAEPSELVVYPAKGQSDKQQGQDKYECYDWAKGQTGFDPMQPAPTVTGGLTQPGGVSAGGLAKGAMGGAAVAQLGHHDAGRGAAYGALGMGAVEKFKQHQATQAGEQQGQQQQVARSQQRATYQRAFSACLEARGYVVK